MRKRVAERKRGERTPTLLCVGKKKNRFRALHGSDEGHPACPPVYKTRESHSTQLSDVDTSKPLVWGVTTVGSAALKREIMEMRERRWERLYVSKRK